MSIFITLRIETDGEMDSVYDSIGTERELFNWEQLEILIQDYKKRKLLQEKEREKIEQELTMKNSFPARKINGTLQLNDEHRLLIELAKEQGINIRAFKITLQKYGIGAGYKRLYPDPVERSHQKHRMEAKSEQLKTLRAELLNFTL